MPNPRLGYLLVALSAACSALNGSLARYLLDDGMSAVRFSQLLAAITWVQTHRPSRSLEEWTSSSPEATGRSPVAS